MTLETCINYERLYSRRLCKALEHANIPPDRPDTLIQPFKDRVYKQPFCVESEGRPITFACTDNEPLVWRMRWTEDYSAPDGIIAHTLPDTQTSPLEVRPISIPSREETLFLGLQRPEVEIVLRETRLLPVVCVLQWRNLKLMSVPTLIESDVTKLVFREWIYPPILNNGKPFIIPGLAGSAFEEIITFQESLTA